MSAKKLKDEHKRFVVRCLARFMPPQEVESLLKQTYEVEITRQSIEAYDPTKVAGASLSDELRTLFSTERDKYTSETGAVRLANKVCRLEELQGLVKKAVDNQNFRWASHLLNQIREEVEGTAKGRADLPGKNQPKANPALRVTIEDDPGTAPPAAQETGESVPLDGN